MPRENAALKARRYLSEGRIVLTLVEDDRVEGTARGDGRLYGFAFRGGLWLCACAALTDQCCHLRAARLVTAPDLSPPPSWGRRFHEPTTLPKANARNGFEAGR